VGSAQARGQVAGPKGTRYGNEHTNACEKMGESEKKKHGIPGVAREGKGPDVGEEDVGREPCPRKEASQGRCTPGGGVKPWEKVGGEEKKKPNCPRPENNE